MLHGQSYLPNNRWREFYGWGLGIQTHATSTWSQIARSALRGYVVSCSRVFIASAAWKEPRVRVMRRPQSPRKGM